MAMKERVAALLILAVVLSLAFPVMLAEADAIALPDNDFLMRNMDDCEYLGRLFFANSENGFVSLRSAPGANREIVKFANGEILNITFTYDHKGEIWGIAEFQSPKTERWASGWLPMAALYPKYDYRSFDADFAHEFFAYDDELDLSGDIVLWSWPGSGDVVWVFEPDRWELDNLTFTHAYRDTEGREWGFIGYLYGTRNVWVCISDPSNKSIPAFNPAPPPALWPAADPSTVPGGDFSTPLLVIILVVVVAMITVVLIRVFWKKDKGNTNA